MGNGWVRTEELPAVLGEVGQGRVYYPGSGFGGV